MSEKAAAFMKANLGVGPDEARSLSEKDLDALYEKAMALEEIKAVEADGGTSEEAEMAARVVDFLYSL